VFHTIWRDNDYRVAYDVTAPNSTTGEDDPASGLVLNIRLALTPGGSAIDTSLNKTATELPGAAGTYACVFEGSDITLYLATVNAVWVVVQAGVGDILCSNRVAVRDRRRAE
jgi:hypothetical protein